MNQHASAAIAPVFQVKARITTDIYGPELDRAADARTSLEARRYPLPSIIQYVDKQSVHLWTFSTMNYNKSASSVSATSRSRKSGLHQHSSSQNVER